MTQLEEESKTAELMLSPHVVSDIDEVSDSFLAIIDSYFYLLEEFS